jgi:flagellin
MKLLDGTQKGNIQAKDGETSIEGSFQSGYVSVKNASDSALCAIDDVIRITVERDITAISSPSGGDYLKLKQSVTAGARLSFVSLQGTTFKKPFQILDAGSDTAILCISAGIYADKSSVVNSAAGENQLKFTIENFTSLKAGDVITLALNKAQESKPITPGEEPLRFQVGANAGQEVTLSIESMKAKDLGIVQTSSSFSDAATADTGAALDVTSQAKASLAIEAYDQALTRISTQRATLGAMQNRLEHTIANLDTSAENLQASESRIRDVDMADEMVEYSKGNILQQAGTSMLSNANSSTQTVLQLLQQ